MSAKNGVHIERLPTGVAGLDAVLGGGLPEYSFNLIAGGPGTGKTTLTHQIVFANASPNRRALYFTVLGEPPIKMLRYQQQMGFFDPGKLDGAIRFINLSREALRNDLSKVLEGIVKEVEQASPGLVVVDSFRTLVRTATARDAGEMEVQAFVQHLAIFLTSWQATTFLVGEYADSEPQDNPVFTVSDGLLWLFQSIERNSIVRKLQVIKMRGQSQMPGLHSFRITEEGVRVFPRVLPRLTPEARPDRKERISSGILGLDEMMGGGVPAGDSVLVAGPSGSGKTVLATQFISQGVKKGERGVIAAFEEHPENYVARAKDLGFDLEKDIDQGNVKVIYLRPLDLSLDETLLEILLAVEEIGAKRVTIDSLSGFELALAPTFRDDFRESLHRMVGALTDTGVTVLMTVEVLEAYDELRFSPHAVSFLADDIILQRYIEIEGQLRRVLAVVKMRRSSHSKDFRAYEITSQGVVVGEALKAYRGIITGVPEPLEIRRPAYPGLTVQEIAVLQALIDLKEGPLEAVARAAGLPGPDLDRALDRVVTLDYAIKVAEKGRTVYRPVGRPLGT